MNQITFALILLALSALGQQPQIVNAKLQAASAAAGLAPAIQSAMGRITGPFWIGYIVPTSVKDNQSCCWQGWNGSGGKGCGLEGKGTFPAGTPGTSTSPVQLEGPTHVSILLRVEGGKVGKVGSYSLDCPLDAGGLPVVWFTGVRPGESVTFLSSLVGADSDQGRSKSDSPVFAIAMHSGAEADAALESFASQPRTERVRKSALFWLANSRGRRGFEVVSRTAKEDSIDRVREHAIFALTVSKDPGAIPAIIQIAKQDRSSHVRGQALFWLSQTASREAQRAITESVESDLDTEVKKKAVFAISQLPDDQGVPKLIELARNNTNPAVRKQAMFWLGQSKDQRAIRFFEEVLTR